MSWIILVFVGALVGLFVIISLLPIISEGSEYESLVQPRD